MPRIHIPHLADNYHEITGSIASIQTVFRAVFNALESSLADEFRSELDNTTNNSDIDIALLVLRQYQDELGPRFLTYSYLLILTATIEKNPRYWLRTDSRYWTSDSWPLQRGVTGCSVTPNLMT